MLAVEDALDGLGWAASVGGVPGLIARTRTNMAVLEAWVAGTPWIDFLAAGPVYRSPTSVCLKVVDPWFAGLPAADQAAAIKRLAGVLEDEGVAYDIVGHRDAPPGLRIWAGATVETANLEALCPWLDWAFAAVKTEAPPHT
jgi:phosphoserine aminotransferase